jgi:glycosyltransferase involved in cell wall biosynthesis
VARPELPSFDLVVATLGRTRELERLLASLERQTHGRLRVLLVDQNEDDRLAPIVAAHSALDVVRLRSKPGLSRARNRALAELSADLVAFPDDDCVYADDLLTRVAARVADEASLDGLSGRAVGTDGTSSPSWERDPALLTDDNLWNRVNAGAIFLRRALVAEVGSFDEELGLGSRAPWSSGEEVDYLVRAVRAGGRVAYDPELTVTHDARPLDAEGLRALGYRDGASIGYILRKHRYPLRVRARMLMRPIGGALLSLAHLDLTGARFHAATLRGRLTGLRASAAPRPSTGNG